MAFRKCFFVFVVLLLIFVSVSFSVAETTVLPAELEVIEQEAFMRDTGITDVVIPNGIKSIGDRAFSGCTGLKRITIPVSVKSIGEDAFAGCEALTIYSYAGYTAESYAVQNQIPFVSLDIDLSDFSFVHNSETESYRIEKYTGNAECPVFPTMYNGLPVTRIGNGAFKENPSLVHLVIPDHITVIGTSAFEGCSSLTDIQLSGAITSIGAYAFESCPELKSITVSDAKPAEDSYTYGMGLYAFRNCSKLTEATIPGSVRSIGGASFLSCTSLQTITIGEGVTAIYSYLGTGAFESCESLTTIYLPSTLETIGPGSFFACKSLQNISIPENVTEIGQNAFSGCEALPGVELPEGLTVLGKNAFSGCTSLQGPVVIPEGISIIEGSTFYGCASLDQVMIPDQTVQIKDYAFSECTSLTNLVLSGATTYIGQRAFSGCTELRTVGASDAVPDGTEENTGVGEMAFSNCAKLQSVTIPGGVKTLHGMVFYQCQTLETVVLREGVTGIIPIWQQGAFESCESLTTIYLPSTLETIGSGSFSACKSLQNISIPENVTEIGQNAFSGCEALPGVELPEGLAVLGKYAFSGCTSLQGPVVIPEGISIIEESTFYGCASLDQVMIPDQTVQIGDYAFSGCISLTNLVLSGATTYIGQSAFSGCAELRTVGASGAVPDGAETGSGLCYEAFRGCEQLESITIPGGVGTVRGYAFCDCYSLHTVVIREGVTDLFPTFGFGVFQGCQNLTTVQLPSSLKTIGYWCFYGCGSLQNIAIPAYVTEIGDYAFYNCQLLPGITIPVTLTSLGECAFYGCTAMDGTIEIPVGVTQLKRYTFYNCFSLEGVSINGNVSRIPDYAFYNCYSLESAILPDSVTSIGNFSFYHCSGLTAIHLTDGLTSIGNSAFYNCSRLAAAYLGTGLINIGESAFYECISLEEDIVFADGLTRIPYQAFYNCIRLDDVTIPRSVTDIDEYAFYGGSGRIVIYGYTDSAAETYAHEHCIYFVYLDAPPEFITGTLGEGITWRYSIRFKELCIRSNDEGVIRRMPDWTEETYIQAPWFYLADDIRSVWIQNGIEYIGSYTFYHYPLREVVVASADLKEIGQHAFDGCEYLSWLRFRTQGLTAIDDYAFAGCSWLSSASASLRLPDETLTSIAVTAFDNISGLKVVCRWGTYVWNTMTKMHITVAEDEYQIQWQHDPWTIKHSIEYMVYNSESGVGNPQLRLLCSLLSAAAYDKSLIKTDFAVMNFDSYAVYNYQYSFMHNVGYAIGYKDLPNGERLILVVIRGSKEPLLVSADWKSDFVAWPTQNDRHLGFSEAESPVLSAVRTIINRTETPYKVLITGHSRGAAVGNLLAADLISGGESNSNVIAYTFACPKVATNNAYKRPACSNVFNYINERDLVPTLPWTGVDLDFDNLTLETVIKTLMNAELAANWGRYGKTISFSPGDASEVTYDWKKLLENVEIVGNNHKFETYVVYASNNSGE